MWGLVFARGVSADLARRLLQTGVVPADEIYAALADAVALGVPFVQVLAKRGPITAELVERELGRMRVPFLKNVRPARELVQALPEGLCQRLLAVPVGYSESGEVEVASVDPFDRAVGAELSHQLGTNVAVMRAPLAEVLSALEDVARLQEQPSYPPIPLVKRSIPPSRPRVDTSPGVGREPDARLLHHGVDETGTSIIGLTRSKAPPPHPTEPELARLDSLESADELVQCVLDLSESLADSVLVLAQRGKAFELRGARPRDSAPEQLRLGGSTEENVVQRAARDGHYLGRLPDDSQHQDLALWSGAAEVYVAPILLGGRPVLALCLAGLHGTLDATRIADSVAGRAEAALERIVREKKRGG
ncbi:MAG: hypothetical protein U0263_12430 [Polyangiaceae bacterium]